MEEQMFKGGWRGMVRFKAPGGAELILMGGGLDSIVDKHHINISSYHQVTRSNPSL